ncbi:FHA domain-containing protein [Marinobacter mobilis]|uniref:FHA domain-containing protein n=1 Tax=Marinobacter mobilis TaxID=488533 RepID=UPI0035C76C2B
MSRFDNSGDDTAPTRLIRRDGASSGGNNTNRDDPTRKLDYQTESTMTGVNRGATADPAASAAQDSPKTVLFRPSEEQDAPPAGDATQPIVAWLVVKDGPGRGRAVSMSYGLNKIGRNPDQAVSLDFGDTKISRSHHAAIEYDPKLRAFYLSKGENLVYLNGDRVGSGQEHALNSGDKIELGDTILQFVAFCGPDFDWND